MISQSCVEQNRTVRVIAKSLFEKSFPPGYKPPPRLYAHPKPFTKLYKPRACNRVYD